MSTPLYTPAQIREVMARTVERLYDVETETTYAEPGEWADVKATTDDYLEEVERDIKVLRDMIASNARHDDVEQAQEVISDLPDYAQAFVQGVAEGYGIDLGRQ